MVFILIEWRYYALDYRGWWILKFENNKYFNESISYFFRTFYAIYGYFHFVRHVSLSEMVLNVYTENKCVWAIQISSCYIYWLPIDILSDIHALVP